MREGQGPTVGAVLKKRGTAHVRWVRGAREGGRRSGGQGSRGSVHHGDRFQLCPKDSGTYDGLQKRRKWSDLDFGICLWLYTQEWVDRAERHRLGRQRGDREVA